jgi:hypothetical protein
MHPEDLRDRLDRLDAALVDIDSGRVKSTPAERAYVVGARDALVALLAQDSDLRVTERDPFGYTPRSWARHADPAHDLPVCFPTACASTSRAPPAACSWGRARRRSDPREAGERGIRPRVAASAARTAARTARGSRRR